MNTYETSATVENQGRIHLAGVPFATGTEVEVTISPKRPLDDAAPVADDEDLAESRRRMRELFDQIKGFRNSPRMSREELYDRGRVH